MLGYDVTKNILDMKSADAVLALRLAFDKVETLASWLANQPVFNEVDPLVAEFGYTADEAYLLRVFFETMNGLRLNNLATFDNGRKITGLE